MAWSQQQAAFATFLILCPTSFFLGIIFSLLPYDYPILWTADPSTTISFLRLEAHLAFLHSSPPIVPRILNIVIATGLLGFFIKLYRPSESNLLFDGASLVLYMIAVVIYVTNTVRGMRVIDAQLFDKRYPDGERAGETMGWWTELGAPKGEEDTALGPDSLGREDSLKVLAATNTILALVLLGVLVLQAGQWYAERKQQQEVDAIAKERAEKAAEKARSPSGSNREHRSPVSASKKKV